MAKVCTRCICISEGKSSFETQLTYHTLNDIRKALIEKFVRLPMGYFEENGSGRLKAMLTDHIEGMERTLAHMLRSVTVPIRMNVPRCTTADARCVPLSRPRLCRVKTSE